LNGPVVIGATPQGRHNEFVEVKGASQVLGTRVMSFKRDDASSAETVIAFCAARKKEIGRLGLTGKDALELRPAQANFLWRESDIESVLSRLQAFASLIQAISGPPPQERRLFEREWLLKPAAKSGSAANHSLGGKLAQPVGCPHCGAATNLMAQIDLSDRALPKTPLDRVRLPVFWCLSCLEWDPAFFDISGSVPRPLSAGGRKENAASIKAGEDDLADKRVMLRPAVAGKKAGHKSKVGGAPAWIQLEAAPDCPRCKKRMAFVLQLTSDSRISYCDMGMLYAFVCPDCRITASLIQSH